MEKITLLYVEDDPRIMEATVNLLGRNVETLLTAADGREGWELFREKGADVVVTDIRMPGREDGLEMARKIKEAAPHVQVIVVTAYADEAYFLRAIDAGVDKYVTKPLDQNKLLEAVRACARRVREHKEGLYQKELIRFLLDSQPAFVASLAGTRVEYLNRTFREYLGKTPEEAPELENAFTEYLHTGEENPHWLEKAAFRPEQEIVVTETDGDTVPLRSFSVSCKCFPEAGKTLLQFTDITQLEAQRQTFRKQAHTDELTGIYNRGLFNKVLDEECHRADRYGTPLSLLLLDLDHFKKINDDHGHPTGDRVLKALAEAVKEELRASDFFARWGGEEFAILTPVPVEEAAALGEKLCRVLREIVLEGVSGVTASFGIAGFAGGDSSQTLFEKGDRALYTAKAQGRNRVVVSN